MDRRQQMSHQIPSDTDILFEISNFNKADSLQAETCDNNIISNKKSPSFKATNLTPEAVKILSSINFDHFRKSPLSHQFDLLFNDVQFFKNAATQGVLIDTNLRTISWMISLECIPFDKNQWLNKIKENRSYYDEIKQRLTVDPRKTEKFPNDHPLSNDSNSDWNSYFTNNELKLLIEQDVFRINRHNEFLSSKTTLSTLIELLFLFVKHTQYDYRQLSNVQTPKLFDDDIDNPIINKINHITCNLLRNNDSELYFYFMKNDISLAPFGIRWLRLLFLRELKFPTCIILWDAIFATNKHNFGLVDYIFISLLMSLRYEILKSDHSNCMKLLMQQHDHLNPLEILKRALYLKYPDTFSNPDILEDSYEYVASHLLPNFQGDNAYALRQKLSGSYSSSQLTNPYQLSNHSKKQQAFNSQPVQNYEFFDRYNRNYGHINKYQNRLLFDEMKLYRVENLDYNKDLVLNLYINEIKNMQGDNQQLTAKINDLQELCYLCSTKLNANICLLQDEISKANIKTDDIMIAIAGFKQVRDQLTMYCETETVHKFAGVDLLKTPKPDSTNTDNERKPSLIQRLRSKTSIGSSKDRLDNSESAHICISNKDVDLEDNGPIFIGEAKLVISDQ